MGVGGGGVVSEGLPFFFSAKYTKTASSAWEVVGVFVCSAILYGANLASLWLVVRVVRNAWGG